MLSILLYLTKSRPDIMAAISFAGTKSSNPSDKDLCAHTIRDQNFRNRGISVYTRKLTNASAWCQPPVPRIYHWLHQHICVPFAAQPGFGSQTFRGIHVGADTSWQKAIDVLLADELVEALTLRLLLKRVF